MSPRSSIHTSNLYTSGLANGKPAILIIIFKIAGANVIETVDRVKAALPSLAGLHPAAHPHQRRAGPHHHHPRRVHDVEITLLIAPSCWSSSSSSSFCAMSGPPSFPVVAVPLSLVGTFGVMYLLGYTLDNLSLMALTISTGFVVDDAIVVIENITRYLEQGMTPFDAAMKGSQGDRLHRALHEHLADRRLHSHPAHGRHRRPALPRVRGHPFASPSPFRCVVSLTTTPMMCAKFLQPAQSERAQPLLPLRRARLQLDCWPATTAGCAGCCAIRTWSC